MNEASARPNLLRAIVLVSAFFASLVAIALSGALDRFTDASGGVSRELFLRSAGLYWLLTCLAVALVVRFRRQPAQVILALVSVVLSFTLFEGAARLLALPAGFPHWDGIASRSLHHSYPPSQKMYAGVYEGEPVFVVTNQDGLRSPYEREAYKAHRTRIAILGDSFTFGFGVAQEDSMPSQLEAQLRRATGDDDIAVLNAGVVSFSPFLERLLFERVVRHYQPQLVLLVLDPTDIGDDYRYAREARHENGQTFFPRAEGECGQSKESNYYGAVIEMLKPALAPLRNPLLYPLQVIGPRIGMPIGKDCNYDYYDFELEMGGTVETNRYFHYRHPLEVTRDYFDATLEQIVATARAAEASGARFALVVSPRFHHWNPEESPGNWEALDYALDEPHQFEYFRYFEGKRGELDFPVFDLLPAFQATEEAPLVFRDDPHWNRAGHRFAARTIASQLVEAGLIEGS